MSHAWYCGAILRGRDITCLFLARDGARRDRGAAHHLGGTLIFLSTVRLYEDLCYSRAAAYPAAFAPTLSGEVKTKNGRGLAPLPFLRYVLILQAQRSAFSFFGQAPLSAPHRRSYTLRR